MIKEDRFYCLGCQHVMEKEKARKVFRTGYYRCDMRLGLCMDCAEEVPGDDPACLQHPSDDVYIAVDPL